MQRQIPLWYCCRPVFGKAGQSRLLLICSKTASQTLDLGFHSAFVETKLTSAGSIKSLTCFIWLRAAFVIYYSVYGPQVKLTGSRTSSFLSLNC